ncbi:DUF6239 family natural product biosynthesis protein [Saccharothrix sp. S26]|uniref:DUF6239 family natural product biosynthesis protein n=1 Tax=Saccharothrix sp. S26 TaxID=2907215 RepID=UPI001F263FBE|nr:DUF6239 family natural product biosynthesis protein [Saccharothrix sp. S26]MCE6996081.1 DUF6239 family natural product biosynthesis protein [Saccharothrix sp. S26]
MHDHAAVGLPLGFTLLRLILLGAVTAVAGWALVRPFAPAVPGAATRRVVTGFAGVGGVVVLLIAEATWMPPPAAVALIGLLAAPPALRRARPVPAGLVVAAAVLATVAAGAWFSGPPSSFACITLMAAFVGVSWLALCPPTAVVRVVGAALGVTLLVGLGQVTIAGRLTTPAAGDPMLTRVAVGGGPVDVLVVPHMPGWNLVQTTDTALSVGNASNALVPALPRDGVTGRWALVWLPEGRSDLWLDRAGTRATVPVDTGDVAWSGPDVRGPEGPDYASAALAAKLAGKRGDLPWPALTGADAAALRARVASIGGPFAVVADDSRRAADAAAVVREEATRLGLAVTPGAPDVLVLGGSAPDGARRHLAPWLAPPDLSTPEARRYAETLSAAFPGATPSRSGLAARSG